MLLPNRGHRLVLVFFFFGRFVVVRPTIFNHGLGGEAHEADNLTFLLVELVLVVSSIATEAVGVRAGELEGLEGWLLNDDFGSLDFGAEWDDLHGRVGDGKALAVGVAHEVALACLLLVSLAGGVTMTHILVMMWVTDERKGGPGETLGG